MSAYGATPEQRRALRSIPCPWCKAAVNEDCSPVALRSSRAITTLAGRAHDARWQAALGMTAPVLTERLNELQGKTS